MTYRQTGRFRRDQYPDDMDAEFTELLRKIRRLRVRIFGPELRELIDIYMNAVVGAALSHQRHDGDDAAERARAEQAEQKPWPGTDR